MNQEFAKKFEKIQEYIEVYINEGGDLDIIETCGIAFQSKADNAQNMEMSLI